MAERARRAVARADAVQSRRRGLAVAVAVARKFGDDRGGQWAALVAYYGFFSLFPLLLVLTTVLSFAVQGNPELRARILDSALAQFPIIGDQIQERIGALEGSVAALLVGVGASIWAGMAVVLTVEDAMNDLWDVPRRERPGFLRSRLRAFLALTALGVTTLAASVLAGVGTSGGAFGWALRALALAGTFLLNACVFGGAFRYLTVARVRWRQVLPGALLAATAWMALLALGTWLVDRQLRDAEPLYGFFAIVLGLLSWIYLGARVMLVSAELNVVLARRLWPRSLRPPPPTEPDRTVLAAEAREEAALPEEEVHVRFGEAGADEIDPPNGSGAPTPAQPTDRR